MATQSTTGYRLQVVLQNKATQVKNYTDSDQIVVNKLTGETLTHRLQNLEVARQNLDEVVKQLRSNVEAFNLLQQEFDDTLVRLDNAEKTVDDTAKAMSNVEDRMDAVEDDLDDYKDEVQAILDEFDEKLSLLTGEYPIVTPSDINGNIRINDSEVVVYTPDRAVVRYGDDIPEDLLNGEVFALFIED